MSALCHYTSLINQILTSSHSKVNQSSAIEIGVSDHNLISKAKSRISESFKT